MSGKHFKKKANKTKVLFLNILELIFLALMVFSGIKIFNWYKENNSNSRQLEKIAEYVTIEKNGDIQEEKYKIDFNALKEKNSDTVAWLKVGNTNIEFPVVQSRDNDFYLSHSFDKNYNSAGWIFMDYTNKNYYADKNVVIYGHNRRDGSMFGTLKNVLSEEWQNNKENSIIPFITEKEEAKYQVFSVYKIEKEDYYITTNFKNDKEYQTFIDKIKTRSVKDFGVKVTSDDNILTLSTCADNNNYRVVLHAKKIVE